MQIEVPEKRYRLAILQRHVIQYHSPIFRELARSAVIDPTVLFLDKAGWEPCFDSTMNTLIEWDVPLLEGFRYEFLANWSPCKTKFLLGRINPKILCCLNCRRYDGVLIQGYDTVSNMLALLVARLAGLDIIFRCEAVLYPGESSPHKEYFKSRLVRAFLHHSDVVLYTCSGNRRFFLHYGCPESRLYAFPCAVDNIYFRTCRAELRKSGNNMRKELGISKETIVVLMVGRMDTNKRQMDLVQATARLKAAGHELATVFVGDGPERERLENFVKTANIENIYFVGFKNLSQISAYYDMADIFCICSIADRSPKVVNEALNFELPVISSDRPGTLGDSIINEENAFVYECGNVEALAAYIEKLIQEPKRRHFMGKRSFELSEKLSLEADVAGLESAVMDLRVIKKR